MAENVFKILFEHRSSMRSNIWHWNRGISKTTHDLYSCVYKATEFAGIEELMNAWDKTQLFHW